MYTFLTSLSTDQWLLVLGFATALGHFVVDKFKLAQYAPSIRTSINYAITLGTGLLFPLATLLATNPAVTVAVHQYVPGLEAFFLSYQGFYILVVRYWRKNAALIRQVESLTTQLNVVAPTPAQY